MAFRHRKGFNSIFLYLIQPTYLNESTHDSDFDSLNPKKEENWLTLRDKKRKQKPKTFKPLPPHLHVLSSMRDSLVRVDQFVKVFYGV
jgi:hypothetical protein